jgi:hypothetical protein
MESEYAARVFKVLAILGWRPLAREPLLKQGTEPMGLNEQLRVAATVKEERVDHQLEGDAKGLLGRPRRGLC